MDFQAVKTQIFWVVPRGDRFIVALPFGEARAALAWLLGGGCEAIAVADVPAWRQFPRCRALLLEVPPGFRSRLRRLPSGGGGSFHPSNNLF
jgi:hypothetical protein